MRRTLFDRFTPKRAEMPKIERRFGTRSMEERLAELKTTFLDKGSEDFAKQQPPVQKKEEQRRFSCVCLVSRTRMFMSELISVVHHVIWAKDELDARYKMLATVQEKYSDRELKGISILDITE